MSLQHGMYIMETGPGRADNYYVPEGCMKTGVCLMRSSLASVAVLWALRDNAEDTNTVKA
jgi:hypothetical protein